MRKKRVGRSHGVAAIRPEFHCLAGRISDLSDKPTPSEETTFYHHRLCHRIDVTSLAER